MTVANNFLEMFVQQARTILNITKELKWMAGKMGKERGALIERFTANTHSLNVYTFANDEVKQSPDVQTFKEKLTNFTNEFNVARFDFDGEVDENTVQAIYDEVLHAYNDMVKALGFDKEIVNVQRF